MSELGAWFSGSLNSATADYAGDELSFGKSYILGLRYGTVVAQGSETALLYVLDIIPLAVITEIPRGSNYQYDQAAVYGLGLSPIGLQLVLPRSRRLTLYAVGTAGFVIFSRGVPVWRSRKFNFRFEAGVGLRLAVASGWTFRLGVGLQHVSNGTSSVPNPGLDHQVLSFGISRLLRL